MTQRFQDELALVRQRYPGAQNGENWVLIPSYTLPVGRFNLATTPLMFIVPVGYPSTGPDNFFVDVNLRLLDGSMPPAFNANSNSSTGPAPIGGNWGWFSWHPQGWRPSAQLQSGDNLLTFISSAGACLRGEDTA